MPGAEHRPAFATPMPAARADVILTHAATSPRDTEPALLAQRAARATMPLLIIGPTASIRLRLARAVHQAAEASGPLRVATAAPSTVEDARTLFLDAALGPDDVAVLDGIVDDGTWLLIGMTSTEDAPSSFAATLGAPAIVATEVDTQTALSEAKRLLHSFVGVDAGAGLEERLGALVEREPGARDPHELPRLIARLAVSGGDIGAPRSSCAPPAEAPAPSSPAAPTAAAGTTEPQSDRFELLLAELAHELRNPLVTLKTVADHLDELAEDADLRGRFSELASDAITRMDVLLDNLIEYGRLGPASPRRLPVGELLTAALTDAQPAFEARNLGVSSAATEAGVCFADPDHLAFALKNVLLGIARTAAPNGDVTVEAGMNGVVRLRFASDVDAATLQRLLAPDQHGALYDPTYQPLPFSLARTVLERSGGGIAVTAAGENRTAIDVHVPVPGPDPAQ